MLRRDAAEGRQIKAAAEQRRISDVVSDAIKAGKVGPARSKHWVSLIQADPGIADVLASVPDNTVPGGHHFGWSCPAAPIAARIWESSTAVYLGVHPQVPFAMPGDRLHRNALQLGVDKQIHPPGHS